MDAAPRTPPPRPERDPATREADSTPFNLGLAARATMLNGLQRDDVRPHLVYDLRKGQTIGVDEMLCAFINRIKEPKGTHNANELLKEIFNVVDSVLHLPDPLGSTVPTGGAASDSTTSVPVEQLPTPADKGKETLKEQDRKSEPQWDAVLFHEMLEKFANATNETKSYEPWVQMTNIALSLLRDKHVEGLRQRNVEDDILLRHNDPNLLYLRHNGERSKRKPDDVFVRLNTAQRLHGDSKATWETVARNAHTKIMTKELNKKGMNLDWLEVLCSCEHKRTFNPSKGKLSRAAREEGHLDFWPILENGTIQPTKKRDRLSNDEGSGSFQKSRKITGSNSIHTGNITLTSWSLINADDASDIPPRDSQGQSHRDSLALQAAEYGLGRLSSTFVTTHAVNLLILDYHVYIAWYDREGIITSSGFNAVQNPKYYLALLFIFQRFMDDDWGLFNKFTNVNLRPHSGPSPSATTPHGSAALRACSFHPYSPWPGPLPSIMDHPSMDVPRVNSPARSKNEISMVVGGQEFLVDVVQPLHKAFVIRGRGTCTMPCRQGTERFVIKLSWPEQTRQTETEILRIIKERAGNCPEIMNHISEVIASDVFDETSTHKIREVLGLASHPRRLVVTVLRRCTGKISQLSGWEFWKVWWECFICHTLLWGVDIRHRDISPGNLMYTRDGDGMVHGNLIDFDLATTSNEKSDNSQRTGTLPYMAIRLLSEEGLRGDVMHYHFYDAESLLWVAVYISGTYQDGKMDENSPYLLWNALSPTQLYKDKGMFMYSDHDTHKPQLSHEITWDGFKMLLPHFIPTTARGPPVDVLTSTPNWKENAEKMRRELTQKIVGSGVGFEKRVDTPREFGLKVPPYQGWTYDREDRVVASDCGADQGNAAA